MTISSDAVFSGRADSYPESARPSPVTPYGAAKAAAEEAVVAVTPDAAVVRTSLIVGDDGVTKHEQRVHELVAHPERGVYFTDDVRCPVHVGDLAAAVFEIAGSGRRGIHHVAGPDCLSRYDLAVLIAQRDGLDPQLLRTGLRSESGVGGASVVRLESAHTRSLLTTRVRGAREFLR